MKHSFGNVEQGNKPTVSYQEMSLLYTTNIRSTDPLWLTIQCHCRIAGVESIESLMFDTGEKTRQMLHQKSENLLSLFAANKFGKQLTI